MTSYSSVVLGTPGAAGGGLPRPSPSGLLRELDAAPNQQCRSDQVVSPGVTVPRERVHSAVSFDRSSSPHEVGVRVFKGVADAPRQGLSLEQVVGSGVSGCATSTQSLMVRAEEEVQTQTGEPNGLMLQHLRDLENLIRPSTTSRCEDALTVIDRIVGLEQRAERITSAVNRDRDVVAERFKVLTGLVEKIAIDTALVTESAAKALSRTTLFQAQLASLGGKPQEQALGRSQVVDAASPGSNEINGNDKSGIRTIADEDISEIFECQRKQLMNITGAMTALGKGISHRMEKLEDTSDKHSIQLSELRAYLSDQNDRFKRVLGALVSLENNMGQVAEPEHAANATMLPQGKLAASEAGCSAHVATPSRTEHEEAAMAESLAAANRHQTGSPKNHDPYRSSSRSPGRHSSHNIPYRATLQLPREVDGGCTALDDDQHDAGIVEAGQSIQQEVERVQGRVAQCAQRVPEPTKDDRAQGLGASASLPALPPTEKMLAVGSTMVTSAGLLRGMGTPSVRSRPHLRAPSPTAAYMEHRPRSDTSESSSVWKFPAPPIEGHAPDKSSLWANQGTGSLPGGGGRPSARSSPTSRHRGSSPASTGLLPKSLGGATIGGDQGSNEPENDGSVGCGALPVSQGKRGAEQVPPIDPSMMAVAAAATTSSSVLIPIGPNLEPKIISSTDACATIGRGTGGPQEGQEQCMHCGHVASILNFCPQCGKPRTSSGSKATAPPCAQSPPLGTFEARLSLPQFSFTGGRAPPTVSAPPVHIDPGHRPGMPLSRHSTPGRMAATTVESGSVLMSMETAPRSWQPSTAVTRKANWTARCHVEARTVSDAGVASNNNAGHTVSPG